MGLALIASLGSGTMAEAAASEGIPWKRSFAAAQAEARRLGRPMVVDFWAEWCGWCHTLDRTTYIDPAVVQELAAFVPVKVNTEGSRAEAEVAMEYGVTSLPTIAFLTPGGRMLLRVSGYQPPAIFAQTVGLAKEKSAEVDGWDRRLKAQPNDPAALAGLGLHLVEQESFDEGMGLLERARRVDAKLPSVERKRVRLALGILHRAERGFDASEAVLKEGLAVKPADDDTDAQLLFVLGRLYLSWGRTEQGVATLKKLIADHPKSPASERARRALAFIDSTS